MNKPKNDADHTSCPLLIKTYKVMRRWTIKPFPFMYGQRSYESMEEARAAMNSTEFEKMYSCTFEVDERDQKLFERVKKYFTDTDDVAFNVSVNEAKALKEWCKRNGYSQGDLNKTKADFQRYVRR
jgi:hypothetical protein